MCVMMGVRFHMLMLVIDPPLPSPVRGASQIQLDIYLSTHRQARYDTLKLTRHTPDRYLVHVHSRRVSTGSNDPLPPSGVACP
jgi:hypothetical protein